MVVACFRLLSQHYQVDVTSAPAKQNRFQAYSKSDVHNGPHLAKTPQ